MERSDTIELFTDGSYEPQTNYGAWAAIILKDKKEDLLTGDSTNSSQHKMELQAVIQGLKYIISNYGSTNSIALFTDSEYVENLLQRKEKLMKKNFLTKKGNTVKHSRDIKEFFSLEQKLNLSITRVRGHQKKGVSYITDYNRKVDKIARKLVKKNRNNINPNNAS